MKPIIFANWKSNPKTSAEAKTLAEAVVAGAGELLNKVEVIICPPFPYIGDLYKILNTPKHPVTAGATGQARYKIRVGAQDCSWGTEGGSFAGEVSLPTLKDMGCEYVLLGHSERKRFFNESETTVNEKLKAVLNIGLKPLLFFGELEPMPVKPGQKEILRQLEALLDNVAVDSFDEIVFAYEPAFAVSTSGGKKLTPAELKEKSVFIRNYFEEKFGKKIILVYGGSVDKDDISGYLDSGVDGAVVGQASLKAESFLGVIGACAEREF